MSWGWTDEDDERLCKLWGEGVSGRLIGAAMQRSRGAVLGRARRLGLSPRPVPVAFMQDVERVPKPVPVAIVQPVPLPAPRSAGRPPQPLRLWLVPTGVVRECQWPEGERRAVRFCGAPACPGRPYCVRHCRVAFIGWSVHRQAQPQAAAS